MAKRTLSQFLEEFIRDQNTFFHTLNETKIPFQKPDRAFGAIKFKKNAFIEDIQRLLSGFRGGEREKKSLGCYGVLCTVF